MRSAESVRAAAGGLLALLLFGGGTCAVGVVYCSEDCDPCVQDCHCDKHCEHALAVDFESAHRMRSYFLTLDRQPDGRWTRTYAGFVGLSLDRALGPGEHDARAIERFTRNVIAANGGELGPRAAWTLAALERTGAGVVATYERPDAPGDALEFLLDRAGNLVAVARHGGS